MTANPSPFLPDQLLTRDVLARLPDGVIVVGPDGRTAYTNPALAALLGHDAPTLRGLAVPDLARLLATTHDLVEGCTRATAGESVQLNVRLTHHDQYAVPVRVDLIAIPAPDSPAPAVLMLVRDRLAELQMEVVQLITSSLDLDDVMRNTTHAIVDMAGLASAAIFLAENGGTQVRLAACSIPFTEEDKSRAVFKLGDPPPGVIAQTRREMYVADLSIEPGLSEAIRARHWHHSSVGYPLEHRDELLGVIAFDAQTVRQFAHRERQTFIQIARQVSLAVHNSRLLERLQHLSITDGLTGLFNHRHLQDRLAEEISRTERSGRPVSVLMIDVDHFKAYNDRQGHPAGDIVLQRLARILNGAIRLSDVACRYGGEEFCVVLPDCPLASAERVAERIRQAASDAHFLGQEHQPGGRLTVSIGVAQWQSRQGAIELIERADRALYEAKDAGRNRVMTHRV